MIPAADTYRIDPLISFTGIERETVVPLPYTLSREMRSPSLSISRLTTSLPKAVICSVTFPVLTYCIPRDSPMARHTIPNRLSHQIPILLQEIKQGCFFGNRHVFFTFYIVKQSRCLVGVCLSSQAFIVVNHMYHETTAGFSYPKVI